MNYEIHLTVSVSEGLQSLEKFKETCSMLGVKAIVIDAYPLRDVMTSHRMKAETNGEVFHAMNHQMLVLAGRGFRVLRVKVETDLSNPQSWDPLPNQYFESHIQLSLNDQELHELQLLREGIDFHISSLQDTTEGFNTLSEVLRRRMVLTNRDHTDVTTVVRGSVVKKEEA